MDSLDNLILDEQFDIDNYFDELKKEVSDKLFEHQYLHVIKMIGSLKVNNCIIDGSDTGTGKTYTTIAICKQLNLQPLILCPKNVISNWKNVCNLFNLKYFDLQNYENIRNCKNNKFQYISNFKDNFIWKIPKNVIIIFDEAHRCKSKSSLNSQIMLSTHKLKNQKILLSATICDTIENFSNFGFMLGFYKKLNYAGSWIKDILRRSKQTGLKCIYKEIFPKLGSRMRMKDLGNYLKKQIFVETHFSKDYEKINKYGKKLTKNNPLEKTTKLLQKIEKIKIDIFFETAKDLFDTGFCVVIFMNYINNMTILKDKLKKVSDATKLIIGETKNREKIINKFQKNKIDFLILSKKLQEGISLHDITGKKRRASIISPSYSSQDLIQTLGRIDRTGGKSIPLQKIIFIEDSFEKKMADKISEKIKLNEDINGDDFEIKI